MHGVAVIWMQYHHGHGDDAQEQHARHGCDLNATTSAQELVCESRMPGMAMVSVRSMSHLSLKLGVSLC